MNLSQISVEERMRLFAEQNRIHWNPDRVAALGWFATERYNIHIRREQGLPAPWTDDPILRDHHFCNVFRRLDRGTRYVLDYILPYCDTHPELTVFNVFAYRRFNLIATHDALSEILGRRRGFLVDWDEARAVAFLEERMARDIRVFGLAWRVQAVPGKTGKGASLHAQCQRITEAWKRRGELYRSLREARWFADAVTIFESLRGVGDFVGFEMALDLNYTQSILRFSEDDYVRVGPGAKRGLDMMVTMPIRDLYVDAIRSLRNTQDKWLVPTGFQGPRLTACDVQFLCEARKYWVAKETGYHKRRYTPRVGVREPVPIED